MKIYKYIIIIAISFSIWGCKKYLDVSKELAGGLTSIDQVFDNPGYSKRWYANVMSGIPDYSGIVTIGMTGIDNPWAGMTDELDVVYSDTRNFLISAKNAANMSFHRWNDLFQLIRQANIFLEKAKVIPPTGTDADRLDQDEFDKLTANVIFMRAYYHYLLFEQYGPIPILNKSLTLDENIDLPRNSVDEVVKFISDELDKVIPLLPQTPITDEQFRANPTKGTALAVKAKLWMYAASPLFNGGFSEAQNTANKDGKKLFPVQDASKWQKALEATKAMVDYADAGNYRLYSVKTGGVDDPATSLYDLFQIYNDEIIWATSKNGWGGMTGDRFDRRCTPRSQPNGLGSTALLQSLVDDFYMSDGLPITNSGFLPASQLYKETGFSNYNGVSVFNMWINREPRFYNTVFFAGRKWHISNTAIFFHVGTPNDRSGQSPPNGYLLYKRFNRRVYNASPGVASVFRPSIIFRLAEFYLLYAEALNEVNPNDPNVLKYVNRIRERAGIPNLEVLNASIVGNKDLQRAAIQRESRIELATEGQRYFDVRRWMIADKPTGMQGGDLSGMNMNGDANTFYQRTVYSSRVFERKQYLYPIPFSEMQKSKNLVQNPGW